jgi:hypothetical protein
MGIEAMNARCSWKVVPVRSKLEVIGVAGIVLVKAGAWPLEGAAKGLPQGWAWAVEQAAKDLA